MSTRIKYSEIHTSYTTQTLAAFLKQALNRLPPFCVVFTDNHLSFTMKYSPYPERLTAFSRQAQRLDVIHALIAKGKPWRNGLIERSNRTDNDALFHQQRFRCEEHRRYQLRLWEMYYNRGRPHQSLNRQTPQALAHQQHFYRTYNLTLS